MSGNGVIFDLDGVICHTDDYHYRAWKSVADEIGAAFDRQVNHRLRGVSRMDSLAIILETYQGPPLSQEEKDGLAERKNRRYVELLTNMSPKDLDPKVLETMVTLRTRGFLLAVGSSSRNTPLILKQLGLSDYFDAVADGNDITRSKPDPEVFLTAAGRLGLPPGRCLVVEDAEAGILAARAGGFASAGIGQAKPLADYPLDSFAQLLGIPFLKEATQ